MDAVRSAIIALLVFALATALLVGFLFGARYAGPLLKTADKTTTPLSQNKYLSLLLETAPPETNFFIISYRGRIKELSSERLVLQDLNDPKKVKTIFLGPAVTAVMAYEIATGTRSATAVAKTDFRPGTEVTFNIAADFIQDKILSATLQISP